MTLITRKQWGARYDDGFDDRPMPITEWWLHHSVTIAPDLLPPFTDDDEAVRTLERIGQQRFKGGISYTYPVTPVGRLYQGVSLHRRGAHTLGHNTKGAAFVLVGDYSRRKPTTAQVEAIARRMVEDHRAGRATRHTLNGGHRQDSQNVGTTECPGDAALAAIPTINARANALWAAGYPNNQEDDMPTAKEIADAVVGAVVGEDTTGIERRLGWSIAAILRDGQRLSAKVAALQVDPASIAAAVVSALPDGAGDVDENALAKAIVVELVKATQEVPA